MFYVQAQVLLFVNFLYLFLKLKLFFGLKSVALPFRVGLTEFSDSHPFCRPHSGRQKGWGYILNNSALKDGAIENQYCKTAKAF